LLTCSPIVIHFGSLGDMVLLTPLLRLLHLRYGRPCRVVSSGTWLKPLLAGHPDVQASFHVENLERLYWLDPGQRRLVRYLRAHLQGVVYVCDDDRPEKTCRLLRRSGVLRDQCRFANPDCPAREGEHRIDRWQRFAAMTPPAFTTPPFRATPQPPLAARLFVNDSGRADLAKWLDQRGLGHARIVLLQPVGNETATAGHRASVDGNDWPVANWLALVQALLSDAGNYSIVLCGMRSGAPLLHRIADAAQSSRVHVADGDLPLRRLMALCEHAAGMVAVDEGLAQIAAAMACPLIVLYGDQPATSTCPRSASNSSPVVALGGSPAHHKADPVSIAETITSWQILPARRGKLDRSSPG
jgi:heptosyltransferase-2/heptosyltransferase-3